MSAMLTIRDETLIGEPLHEWALEVAAEKITIRELIRSRVYQEVQDYNVKQGQVYHGLVQPEDAEKTLNGWMLKKPRMLDWKQQVECAVVGFENSRILILINDLQAESLDEEFVVEAGTSVTFLRLTPLVGG
jgi:hypothetical protein